MKHYTWEEKIDTLAKLAKLIGTYLEVEIEDPGSDGHKETREQLEDAYEEFCQWRHDEPYVVDEIQGLLGRKEYKDAQTGVRLTVERDNPGYPEHPKLTIVCPDHHRLSLEEVNGAIARLLDMAHISPALMPPLNYAAQEKE